MKFPPKTLAAATCSAALLALAPGVTSVQAQQQTQQPAQQTQPQATPELDDGTIRAFAQASLEVQEVADKWKPRIQDAEGQEAEQLRNEANQEIVQAVQSSGLELQTYNQIFQAAQANPEVATKIRQYWQEME